MSQPTDNDSISDDERPAASTVAASSDPPPGSQITIDRFRDGVTIQFPAAGIAGTRGLFAVALIVDAALAVVTLFILFAVFGGQQQPPNAIWAVPVILSVFWIVGLGFLLASLNMARRRAAFAVTGGMLMVIQTGLFGSKRREWEPGDVEAVRLGPSGLTVNDKPVFQLHIVERGGHKHGFLTGRSDADMEWVAAELRQALHVPESAS